MSLMSVHIILVQVGLEILIHVECRRSAVVGAPMFATLGHLGTVQCALKFERQTLGTYSLQR